MVGVANSNGCVTCRSRKVKCDLQRPSCGKCIKAGRECGGYRRDRVFIVGTQDDQGRCSSHPKRGPLIPRSKNKRELERYRHTNQSPNYNATYDGSSGESQSPSSTSTSTLDHERSISPHPLVQAAHANMRQFIVQNADDFLLKPLFETSPNSKVPSLLNYLPEMANGSKLFNRGILAFCLQAAGKKNNDARLNNASLEMTIDAMKELQIIIPDSEESKKVEVVAASITMGDCEIMLREAYSVNNRYYNWQGLLRGTAALVKERGPSSFSQYPDYQLFTRGFRGNGVLEAIGRRQHTFLASPDWLTIPWSKGIEKDAIDVMFDLMAQMSSCLADTDLITHRATHDPIPEDPCDTNAKSVLKKLFELADAFSTWFTNLQNEAENLCTMVPTPEDSIFPFTFAFPNFRLGMLHMFSWSSLILIYDCIEQLQVFLDDGHDSPPTPPYSSFSLRQQQSQRTTKPNHNTPAQISTEGSSNLKTIRAFALNICQSLDSLLSAALCEGWSVVHMLVFPVWIVNQCYRKRSEEESQFIAAFLKKMIENDIMFAESLCNMSFEDYAKM